MNFKTSYQMLPNHPDGEFEIMKMFQEILPDIEKLDKNSFEVVEEIEKILKSIAYEHRFDQFKYGVNNFFIQPWDKVKTALIHVALHFKQLKQFIKKEVYVDEVIINDFIHRSVFSLSLSDSHDSYFES